MGQLIRSGSWVDHSARRGRWATRLLPLDIVLTCLLVLVSIRAEPDVTASVPASAWAIVLFVVGSKVAFLLADLLLLRELEKIGVAAAGMRVLDEGTVGAADQVVDLGVGDIARASPAFCAATYREPARPRFVLRGDATACIAAVRANLQRYLTRVTIFYGIGLGVGLALLLGLCCMNT